MSTEKKEVKQNSRLDEKLYYYAEITVEALSPLVLASGKSGNFFDVELVRDANGLPAIPGTTIAGILRHAVQELNGKNGINVANELFGFQNGDEGRRSSVEVSWAYVHDSENKYHKSFYPREKIEKDLILNELYMTDNPAFKRDHVRLSEKGTTFETGKFDRYFVPTGSRFTFSIGLWSNNENENWDKLLNILASPLFRIGAAGRTGYGKIDVIGIKIPDKNKNYFDLSNDDDIEAFRKCNFSTSLDKESKLDNSIGKEELELSFPLGFRIGGGSKSFLENNKHPADSLPYSEKVIKWNEENGKGMFDERWVITIPGASVKGALRHRAAYHLARKKMTWTEEQKDDGLSELFGYAADENNSENKGKAGKIWFSDLYLDLNKNKTKTYPLSRNSIDRFTGGTKDGALFQEENAYSPYNSENQKFETYTMTIYYDSSIKDSIEYKAFDWAVKDLKAGRLAIGGGSGHGLGFSLPNKEEEKK